MFSIFGSCSCAVSPLRSGGSNCGVPKRSRRDQAGRRNVTRSCQCGGGRIQACRRSERWRVFGRGRIEEVRRCAGRFERAVTMVLLLRDDREPRLDLPCRRATLLGSSTSFTSPVSCATAMQRFGSDGSNSGHGGCALETALLTPLRQSSAKFCFARKSRQCEYQN